MTRLEQENARARRKSVPRNDTGLVVKTGWPGRRLADGMDMVPPERMTSEIVRAVIDALYSVIDGADPLPDRRAMVHRRQIAMYVMHVVLRWPLTDIGEAFGRDRSTVRHACAAVEDRRDEAGYDRFVSTAERLVAKLFGAGVSRRVGR